MSLFDSIRRKKRLLRQLLTEEASKNFVHAFYRQSKESPFKVGDTIHTERYGIPWGPLDVTGLKTGGQAIIYTVLANNGASIYALKTFQNWCYRERGMFERFMREAEIMIDLGNHPNLLRADSVFSISGRPYILLEYVAGSSLRQKLASEALSIEEATRHAIEICRGLSHAQAALPTFIHRDIKPDNCLVTNDGVLKIADFGQAKTARSSLYTESSPHCAAAPSSSFGSRTTLAGHWGAGTPEYMAPEQFRTDSAQDVRTDVYSFGVLLFELLTGELPFNAEEHEELFKLHQSETLPDLRSINTEIPKTLSELVSRCLAKSKEERPKDFSEIERDLQTIRFNLFGTYLPLPVPERERANDALNRGLSLLEFERYQDALKCFWRSNQDGLRSRAALCTSVALGAENRLDEAESVIDKVLAEYPKDPMAHNQRGLLLKERKRFAEAIRSFDQAVRIDSKFVSAINSKAACLIELGELAGALSTSKRSLAIEPRQKEAFRNLAETYRQMNQRPQALDYYLKAVEADPRDVHSLVQLSNELMRAGRYAEAIDQLEQAVWLTEGMLNRKLVCSETIEFFAAGAEKVLSLAGKDDSTIYQWFVVATYLNCLDSGSLCALADDLIACVSRWRTLRRAEVAKCLKGLSESDYQLREVRKLVDELDRYECSLVLPASVA